MLVDFGFSYLFAKEFLLFIASLEVTYGGSQLSRQNQKPHGKNKNITAKAKYLTAKPKTSRQKQNTSRQNQKPHGKTKYSLRSRRLEVMGERENGRARGRHASPRVSPSRAPVFSCANHFQAPATQAKPNTSQQKQNSFGFDVGVCF